MFLNGIKRNGILGEEKQLKENIKRLKKTKTILENYKRKMEKNNREKGIIGVYVEYMLEIVKNRVGVTSWCLARILVLI